MSQASPVMQEYFDMINKIVLEAYEVGNAAKAKGFDPDEKVNIPLAKNMAERVEGLISVAAPQIVNSGMVERIVELEEQFGKLDWRVAFSVSLEVAQQKFCAFETELEAMEVGIRVGVAYLTVGVVASPLEGFTKLVLRERKDGTGQYFALYYSGPIRSAGGTAASVSVVLADYIRVKMGYKTYDPTENEIKRMQTELRDYHERVTNLQYFPSEKEIEHMVAHLPVQIDGDPSEKFEVSNYKDLDRIETDRIRNGICLVIGEGLTQKAPKVWKQLSVWGKEFGLDHWKFLDEFLTLQKKIKAKQEGKKSKEDDGQKIKPDYTFIKDLVAGRPIFTHPLRTGGFRLRYGRARNTGLSATAVHPATMHIVERFLGVGTQLKTERPGKGTAISCCDSIDGPIVRLKGGDVRRLETFEQAKQYSPLIEEILFLGDLLISYGDFINRAHPLVPAGFNEEWFEQILKDKQIPFTDVRAMSVDESYKLAVEHTVPMHPRYTFHFQDVTFKQFLTLLDWIEQGVVQTSPPKLILPLVYNYQEDLVEQDAKSILEILGVPHAVITKEHVVVEKEWAQALIYTLGLNKKPFDIDEIRTQEKDGILAIISKLAGITIKDKSGTFIGARMGRPEKAKMRKLTGSPQALFPVGAQGGKLRSFQAALKEGKILSQFPKFHCKKCDRDTIYRICEQCQETGVRKYFCQTCEAYVEKEVCEIIGKDPDTGEDQKHGKTRGYFDWDLPIEHYFKKALNALGRTQYPDLIKGVRGTSNEDHTPEYLAKGILRSLHDLYVNKDGTIRYDMTELPITHFKPNEIGIDVETVKKLGYTKDTKGELITDPNQVIEIKPQDIILPSCPESVEEGADIVFYRVAQFVDELLVKLYGLKPYYNLKTKKDLVGHLVVALAPHTSAGIICRIIGFSQTQGMYAHPMMHCAVRRDCLAYGNYVSIKKDGAWQIEKIGDVIEKLKPNEKVDSFGTLKKDVSNTTVWSNPGEDTIKEVTKHTPSSLLKVVLECGRTIQLTQGHRVYTKGKIEKRARNISVGDQLMVSYKRRVKAKDIKELFLPEIFLERDDVMLRNVKDYLDTIETLKKNTNYYRRDSFPVKFVKDFLKKHKKTLQDLPDDVTIAIKRDNVSLPIRVPLDEELLECIGLYIAEGFTRKNESKKGFYQVSIAATVDEIKDLIRTVFSKYFKLKPSEDHIDHLTFSSKLVYLLFNDYFKLGARAKEKRIPSLFLDLKKNKMAALLRGYYEGDGSVSISDTKVTCDTVSEGLKHDLSFVLSRFGIFTKFYDHAKKPGPVVREFYVEKKRPIPTFAITKIIIPSNFVKKFGEIGFISIRKNKILDALCQKIPQGMRIEHDNEYVYPKVKRVESIGDDESYCFNVENEHNFFANDILVHNCDGDEAAVILLMDTFLNFSRRYLPAHRGAVQDAPLIITSQLIPSEVDDMVFDMDIVPEYPLELYETAEKYGMPWDVKVKQVKSLLDTPGQYEGMSYTHEVTSINQGVLCSAYKSLPTMKEKVFGQMAIAEKTRAVDELDVARLVIERHFVRDIKGNLRKFSMQQFRCVQCNEKYRRPPLQGICTKCSGKLLFTIAEGSVVKYLEPSIELAERYQLPPYLKQTLELVKQRIESVFGKEAEKQVVLRQWFDK